MIGFAIAVIGILWTMGATIIGAGLGEEVGFLHILAIAHMLLGGGITIGGISNMNR